MDYDIRILRRIPEAELTSRLRVLTLLNSTVRPYEAAEIRFASVPPDLLFPAALYVARPNLERQRTLREALLRQGADTLDLHGGVEFQTGNEVWTVIPPVVEFQSESAEFHPRKPGDPGSPPAEVEIPLINDGLHRVWLARELGVPVRVALIRGVPAAYPYYAFPAGWSRVKLLDDVPADKAARKRHRTADYYALYRDFGPLGVGKPRHPEEILKGSGA
jgi:hypothetical protein